MGQLERVNGVNESRVVRLVGPESQVRRVKPSPGDEIKGLAAKLTVFGKLNSQWAITPGLLATRDAHANRGMQMQPETQIFLQVYS